MGLAVADAAAAGVPVLDEERLAQVRGLTAIIDSTAKDQSLTRPVKRQEPQKE